jgi:GNAT superfamily N-acetyltransferase
MGSILDTRGSERPQRQKIDQNRLEFRPFSEPPEEGLFSCGYTVIDNWFENSSLREHSGLFCRIKNVYLDGGEIPAGFYAMCLATEPEYDFTDGSFFDRLNQYFSNREIIVCHLKWVAVDSRYQRQGIGTLLMGHAIDDFYEVIKRTGVAALTLRAINENARKFYSTLGFADFGDQALHKMLLPAQSVVELRLLGTM